MFSHLINDILKTLHVTTSNQSDPSFSSLVFTFAGVKNADENELKAIASPPAETHVYNVADFSVMSEIVEGLTKTVCDRVEQLDKRLKGLKSDDDGLITRIHCRAAFLWLLC